jgi:peptide deformylase
MSRKISFVDGEMVEWEILKLVDQYDPILRTPTIPVNFDVATGQNIAYASMSLMKTCEYHNGLGLAANQVGIKYSMCAINHIDENKVFCLINPVITSRSPEMSSYNEGCLSFPGLFLKIPRNSWVEVSFRAGNGTEMTKKFEGIWATCVQHELDHLAGICYTDLVSPIKLDIAKRKIAQNMRKIRKATTGA